MTIIDLIEEEVQARADKEYATIVLQLLKKLENNVENNNTGDYTDVNVSLKTYVNLKRALAEVKKTELLKCSYALVISLTEQTEKAREKYYDAKRRFEESFK